MRQLNRVRASLGNNRRLSLAGIKEWIYTTYNVMDSEAAISARLRDLRKGGLTISKERRRQGFKTYHYWIEKKRQIWAGHDA